MTLLVLESFDSFGAIGAQVSPTGVVSSKYDTSVTESYFNVEAGETDKCLKMYVTGTYFAPSLDNTDSTLTLGLMYYIESNNYVPTTMTIAAFKQGTTNAYTLVWKNTELAFYTNYTTLGNLLGTTQGLRLQSGVWYNIEIKVTCHPTAGAYEVRINGVNVLSGIGDTDGAGVTAVDKVFIYGSYGYTKYDNLYICNGAGSVNNSFLGALTIEDLRPDGDDTANFTSATPSASHFANVDEDDADDTAYNQSSTSGHIELYDHGSITNLDSVVGVQLNARVKTTTGVTENFQHVAKSALTTYNSANVSTNVTDHATFTHVLEEDPDTSAAWTISTVNAAKFGLELP